MRRFIPLIVLVLLATAPAARAKELPAEVCGAGGCVTVSDPGQVGGLHSTGAPAAMPEPAAFYVVRFRSGVDSQAPIAWSYLYVPSARAMRANDFGSGPIRWSRAPSLIVPILAEVTKGLEPYPASPTWTAGSPARDKGFPVGWVALGALAGAAVVALALRRLGRLPFAGELGRGRTYPGPSHTTRHAGPHQAVRLASQKRSKP